jgi:predicted dehydrogenase
MGKRKMLKILIVGFGSIGKRHCENLKQIGDVEVSILSRQNLNFPDTRVYSSVEEACRESFDAVIIANETARHIPTAIKFAEKGYNLFIEKPLSHNLAGIDKLTSLVDRHNLKVMMGCNMRFHPVISSVEGLIRERRIGRTISARAEVGQYLPDWRPGRDYRNSYSASKEKGGGVILDLIHELDYTYRFFGDVRRVFSFGGKRSDLEIETEDIAEILMEFENGTIAEVHLDYLQHNPSRNFKIIGTSGTICADLTSNKVEIFDIAKHNWEVVNLDTGFDKNKMYLDEMKHFVKYIQGKITEPVVSLSDGIKVLQIALAAKESALTGKVIDIQN